jgi:HEAT repeat protein
MNELLRLLSGGDLRSDGKASSVADEVIEKPHLLLKLLEGLTESDSVIRARTAHALERISRSNPEMLIAHLPQFIDIAKRDQVPMVRWHLAMTLANLAVLQKQTDSIISALFDLLDDKSVFVRSWSMASLTILGRRDRGKRAQIINRIRALQNDESTAIRARVSKAVSLLENEEASIPVGWVKSTRLRNQ